MNHSEGPYAPDDLPPPMETMTFLTGRCVMLDADGNVPPGERLFNVYEIPNPLYDSSGGPPG